MNISQTFTSENRLVIRDTFKTLMLTLLFVFANLVILLEFNTREFTNSLIDNYSKVYNKNINSSFNNGYSFNWTNGIYSFTFDNQNLYNLDYRNYQTKDDLKKDMNSDEEFSVFVNLLEEYFEYPIFLDDPSTVVDGQKIHDNVEELGGILFRLSPAIIGDDAINLNNRTISWRILKNFIIKVLSDYDQLKKIDENKLEDSSKSVRKIVLGYDSQIQKIRNDYEDNFNYLNSRLQSDDVYLTLNNVYVEKDVDFPIYRLNITPTNFSVSSNENWKLYFLNNQNQKVFQWESPYNEVEAKLKDYRYDKRLPVVVSKHLAKLNNIKKGKQFHVYLSYPNYGSMINLLVKDIVSDDIYTNNIYADADTFNRYFADQTIPKPLYNEVFTTRQVLQFDSARSVTSAKVNLDYFNFFYPAKKDEAITALDIYKNLGKFYGFIDWNNFSNDNFMSIDLNRELAREKVGEFYQLLDLLIIATVLIVLILYLVFALVNVNDKKNLIAVLKAMGYGNGEINFSILGKYFVSEIIAVLVGLGISYLIWFTAIQIIFKQAGIIITNPFSWIISAIVLFIVMSVLVIGAFSSYFLIKKIAPTYEDD